MTILEFIKNLKDRKIFLTLKSGDQLAVRTAGDPVDPLTLNSIRERKPEILHFLKTAEKDFDAILPKAPSLEEYPLSPAQHRLWILCQQPELSVAYNIPSVFHLDEIPDPNALKRGLDAVIRRHEILRTVFRLSSGVPVQVILPADQSLNVLEMEDPSEKDHRILEKNLAHWATGYQFQFETGPLFRMKVAPLAGGGALLGFVIHHIIADAWSVKVFLNDLSRVYAGYVSGAAPHDNPPDIQYKDFAYWHQTGAAGEQLLESGMFWQRHLGQKPASLNLLPDRLRHARRAFRGGCVRRVLNGTTACRFAGEMGLSVFQCLLASVQAFLYRITGTEEVVLGTTSAGRNRAALQHQIGFYVNLFALRQKIRPGMSFRELLRASGARFTEALEHEEYPFHWLTQRPEYAGQPGRNPIFDVLVEYLGPELNALDGTGIGGLALKPVPIEFSISKFDLSFRFLDNGNQFEFLLEYNSDIFEEERIDFMAAQFEVFLTHALSEPDIRLESLDIMTGQDRRQILENFNQQMIGLRQRADIVEIFREKAAADPDKVAVIFENEAIRYKDLDERSDKLAGALTESGVQPEDRVAILLPRSVHAVVSVLGVLKAHAVFVLLDTAYPGSRLAYILEDSAAAALVVDSETLFRTPGNYRGQLISADMLPETENHRLHKTIDPSAPAYILYTSGSTGRPKGVSVSHGSLLNYLEWANAYYYENRAEFPFGLFTSLAFDLSLTGLLGTLLRGDTLHVFPDDRTPETILTTIFEPGSPVKAVKLTPSHIRLLDRTGLPASGMESVIIGGEALQADQLETLFRLNRHIAAHNEYGPTETTVGCTVETYRSATGKITIGRPAAGARIYILDAFLNLLPHGVPGEIYIGGKGVASGYWKQPELTAERFLPDPFVGEKERRMYKSGDLGRWLPDGRIEYLGRGDDQVKIRGFRIETGEVEQQLLKINGVREARVIARRDAEGDHQLAAYLTGEEIPDPESLRLQLEAWMPLYMIPTLYFKLPALPLNENGKTDLEALAGTDNRFMWRKVTPSKAANETETWLALVFQPLLSGTEPGLRENLFTLGLDSLKTVTAFAAIEEKYPGRIKIHEIFSNPSIGQLAQLIAPEPEPATDATAEVLFHDF